MATDVAVIAPAPATVREYAISMTDGQGRVWYLVRPSALAGSMIRTRSPFEALTFPRASDCWDWVRGLPENHYAQLADRDLEIREVEASAGPVVEKLRPTEEDDEDGDVPAPAAGDDDEPDFGPGRLALGPAPAPAPAASQPPPPPAVAAPAAPDDDDDEPDFGPASKGAMPGFVAGPQQSAFLGALAGGDTHLLLEARAGSGKSTTCRAGAWELAATGKSSTYCCFNSSIAQEFRAELPRSCRASTLHSLGFALIRSALGEVQVDEDKVDRLMDKYFDRRQRPERAALSKLVDLARNLLVADLSPGSLMELAADYEVELLERSYEDVLAVVPEVVEACRANPNQIDFTDMIWLPVALGLRAAKSPDVLFVDEAQDLNACQHEMVGLLCPEGRTVVVGDRYQAIYGFRGADAHSIPTLSARLESSGRGLQTYPLTVTRRCPVRHVEMARRIVPDLDHLPGAIEGEIVSVPEGRWTDHVAPGDMVLCRTNAPLVSACYRLIRSGVKATVRGRDIGKGLLALVARLRASGVPELMRKLGDYRAAEGEKIAAMRNPGPKLAALQDKVDCLIALCEGASTVDAVRERASSMFSDIRDDDAVTLSSVHRAKGLERRRVVILRPDLLPGPWAARAEDVQQERNLAYVAATRARETLVFAGPIPALLSS